MYRYQSFSLQDHFLRMGPQSQPQVLSFMFKCYSALTDPLISRQSFEQQFNQISLFHNLAQDFPCVQDYLSMEVFRQFFKNRLKDISLHNNCEVIEYPFRKIYKEIKQAYFSSGCYLECQSVLSSKDIPLSIDEYYLHKTIDFYSLTLESSLEGRIVNDEYVIGLENEVTVKIGLRTIENYYEKKNQFPHFNHGFFIQQDKHVIMNNLNIIKLVKVESIKISRQKHLKLLVFQLISFIEIIQMRGTVLTPQSQSVKKQCNQLLNYLESTKYMVQLEIVYHKDKHYELATATSNMKVNPRKTAKNSNKSKKKTNISKGIMKVQSALTHLLLQKSRCQRAPLAWTKPSLLNLKGKKIAQKASLQKILNVSWMTSQKTNRIIDAQNKRVLILFMNLFVNI